MIVQSFRYDGGIHHVSRRYLTCNLPVYNRPQSSLSSESTSRFIQASTVSWVTSQWHGICNGWTHRQDHPPISQCGMIGRSHYTTSVSTHCYTTITCHGMILPYSCHVSAVPISPSARPMFTHFLSVTSFLASTFLLAAAVWKCDFNPPPAAVAMNSGQITGTPCPMEATIPTRKLPQCRNHASLVRPGLGCSLHRCLRVPLCLHAHKKIMRA